MGTSVAAPQGQDRTALARVPVGRAVEKTTAATRVVEQPKGKEAAANP
jgi:hypothetical protein